MKRRLAMLLIPGCLIVMVVCVIAGYWFWSNYLGVDAPGVGPKAEQGYQVCAQIITALERYHAEQGVYPQTLELLAPAYLPGFSYKVGIISLDYRLDGQSYKLIFRYSGPGLNTCTYTPGAKWTCSGYY